MTKKPEGGEFFQIGPDGKPTDTALHAALLGADDKFTFDLNDPRQYAERLAEVEERRRQRAAKKG